MMNTFETSKQNAIPVSQLWLRHLDKSVLRRSVVVALVLGSILTLTNQSAAIFGNNSFNQLLFVLAFITPFVVITLSQLGAIQQVVIDRSFRWTSGDTVNFIDTIIAHNIPLRAVVISLIVGSFSSVIILLYTILKTGAISQAPLSQLILSYFLPLVFGAFSQTLTYRRYADSSSN